MRASTEATASADLTRVLLRHASRIGLEARDVCRAVDIDPAVLETPGARLSLARFAALWEAVASRAGDPDFGLHLGAAIVSSASGHLLLAVLRNCPTVADAIDRFFRYHDLLADILRPEIRRGVDAVHVVWMPGSVHVHRHHVEAVFSTFVTTLRQLTEDRLELKTVRFRHPGPASAPEHRRIFGAPVLFGEPVNEVVFERRWLALPIPLASSELLRDLEALAQRQLARVSTPATWAEKTASAISAALLGGQGPGVDTVAGSLAVGSRTLQTKLKQEGTTYRRLLDKVRRELAAAFLKRADLALYDVAFLLGFAEQSAWNHAFKRWTGMTPSEFRRRHAPVGSGSLDGQ